MEFPIEQKVKKTGKQYLPFFSFQSDLKFPHTYGILDTPNSYRLDCAFTDLRFSLQIL
ncbi:hypothetical protein Spico_1500 [Parasphaerochaeta coccoides DSM 17374]|uniref:Uncharacterized protein n=1 Tax=Parasphaerochaeta coccoides (strain ATCC BAA-1237 / DSM 17374 / SPN1) TaxID=760011 RepID=F4GIT5_PARC1|nr:hypothetical protein Spico_1500 [Parasphaerochaeta coccoides DSM 17374]